MPWVERAPDFVSCSAWRWDQCLPIINPYESFIFCSNYALNKRRPFLPIVLTIILNLNREWQAFRHSSDSSRSSSSCQETLTTSALTCRWPAEQWWARCLLALRKSAITVSLIWTSLSAYSFTAICQMLYWLCSLDMAPPSTTSNALACMAEIQEQCFKMGIPLRTRLLRIALYPWRQSLNVLTLHAPSDPTSHSIPLFSTLLIPDIVKSPQDNTNSPPSSAPSPLRSIRIWWLCRCDILSSVLVDWLSPFFFSFVLLPPAFNTCPALPCL